jgi:hypothetical protein
MAAWAIEHDVDRRPSIEEVGDLLMRRPNDEPQWTGLACEIKEALSAEAAVVEFAAKLGPCR